MSITSQEFVKWRPYNNLLTDDDIYEGVLMMDEMVDVKQAVIDAVIVTDTAIGWAIDAQD